MGYRERFADTLKDMGFKFCVIEPDLLIRCNGRIWKLVCVYIDELFAILVLPKIFFDTVVKKYKYQC